MWFQIFSQLTSEQFTPYSYNLCTFVSYLNSHRKMQCFHLFLIDVEIFQSRVKPPENGHHSLISLEEKEEQNAEVNDAQAKYHPPDCRMRSSEGTIWKCQHGNDQEKKEDPADSSPNIILVVTLISEIKKKLKINLLFLIHYINNYIYNGRV